MKRPRHIYTLILLLILTLSGCDKEEVDMGLAVGAGVDAFKALTLSDDNVNAQYSQKEEKEADDYGVLFLQNAGISTTHAASALQKLAALGGNHSFLSSHPAPRKRVERLQEQGVVD